VEKCARSPPKIPRRRSASRSNTEYVDYRRQVQGPRKGLQILIYLFLLGLIRLSPTQKIKMMEEKLFASPLHKDPRLSELYTLYAEKKEIQERIRALKAKIQNTHDVLQLEELKCRKRVLRRLGFTTSADIVDMKGRVACEISTGDELLLTELIFDGVFNTLSPELCAALLSCFVFDEKVSRTFPILTHRVERPSRVSKLASLKRN